MLLCQEQVSNDETGSMILELNHNQETLKAQSALGSLMVLLAALSPDFGNTGEGSKIGHFLRGGSLKGRCSIRVYVPVCVPVCVCVCVCVSLRSPPDPAHSVGLKAESPPTPTHDPSHPSPHLYLQAFA